MARVRWTSSVIVCLAVLLAACGKSTVRPHATEQTVADFVFKQTGFRATDVRCPSGIPAKVGSTFDCHFTGPEGPYTAHVRITSVHGQRATEDIVTRPSADGKFSPRVLFSVRSRPYGKRTIRPHDAEQVVVDVVFGQTRFRPTDVRCPSGVEARVGVTFDCHFTGPEGPYTAHMRITMVQGARVLVSVLSRPST
jgi:hypothetical protein